MTDQEAVQAASQTAIQSNPMNDPAIQAKLPFAAGDAEAVLRALNPMAAVGNAPQNNAPGRPFVKFGFALMRDQDFSQSLSDIQAQYSPVQTMGYEVLWILCIWTLRAWRLSKAGTWLTRIWVQLWVSGVFWLGALVLVPLFLWGKSYQTFLGSLLRTLLHQF